MTNTRISKQHFDWTGILCQHCSHKFKAIAIERHIPTHALCNVCTTNFFVYNICFTWLNRGAVPALRSQIQRNHCRETHPQMRQHHQQAKSYRCGCSPTNCGESKSMGNSKCGVFCNICLSLKIIGHLCCRCCYSPTNCVQNRKTRNVPCIERHIIATCAHFFLSAICAQFFKNVKAPGTNSSRGVLLLTVLDEGTQ